MLEEDIGQDLYEFLARIAHRYYVDDRTQEEIAREFALSRAKVQRLLVQARRAGVVSIAIQSPPSLHLELEHEFRTRFHLTDAIVSASQDDPQSRR
jgi:DNA-binding transcriptional regulator LsrR (DeoR family)